MTKPATKTDFLERLKSRFYTDCKQDRITVAERQTLLEHVNDLKELIKKVYNGKKIS